MRFIPLCLTFGAFLALSFPLRETWAQSDTATTSLGIASVAAAAFYLGTGKIDFAEGPSAELGLALDLGWFRSRRMRVVGELEYLRGVVFAQDLDRDLSSRGPFFDLSANVSFLWLAHVRTERFTPYAAAGAGIHILSSSLGIIAEDERYNQNQFGLHVAAGTRFRTSRSGRYAGFVELRRALASDINRTSARVGGLWYFGDLARSSAR